jgi:response regulator of citrate/malate metabolism
MLKYSKVLITEDEAASGVILSKYLQELGCSVVGIAQNYTETIDMALNYSPDILCMDIHLGGEKDGVDAVTYLRNYLSFTLIYVTGKTDRATFHKALNQTEFTDFLIKPVSFTRLQDAFAKIPSFDSTSDTATK